MAENATLHFKKGEVLIHEGDEGKSAYIIERGNVEILVKRDEQDIRISTRGPGSIIGEMAIVDDRPRTATVRAMEDCAVTEISREDLSRRIDNIDPVLKMVMRVILARYRDMMARTEFTSLPPALLPHAMEDSENNGEIHEKALSTLKTNNELRRAVAENEFILHYQPIIDLTHMRIAGFEALMRWQHPEKGMIPPGMFIPVAEESGIITEMSRWALDTACDAIKSLREAANTALLSDLHPLFMSVNFSVKDFSDGAFFEHVKNSLQRKDVSARNIHLEITESLLMEAPEMAKDALEKCREYGLGVSIDDFGTGYSSLGYLHYFPISTLKIDQSFIRSMSKHPSSHCLVKSIINLAKNLNMQVIAEGIETIEEARMLRELQCDFCQGYWFSKPLPFDAAMNFAKNWTPPSL